MNSGAVAGSNRIIISKIAMEDAVKEAMAIDRVKNKKRRDMLSIIRSLATTCEMIQLKKLMKLRYLCELTQCR